MNTNTPDNSPIPEDRVLALIAALEMKEDCEAKFQILKGMTEHWLSTLPPAEAGLLLRYKQMRAQVAAELANTLDEDFRKMITRFPPAS